MTPSDKQSKPTKSRRRALRAAQVVTLGLALAGGGCYGQHAPPIERTPPPEDDAGLDSMIALGDAGADAEFQDGALASDAGLCDPTADWEEYSACCNAHDWNWDWGCMAWGPFVPPADGALPAPRASLRVA